MNEKLHSALALVAALGEIEGRGQNLVTSLLGDAPFHELAHYPPEDVTDPVSHAQYYFHAHRRDGSSGHIHCFLRGAGLPKGAPAACTGAKPAGLTHVAAVALDQNGRPARLFTTNLWVTGDDFYPAEALIARLPAMDWSHAPGPAPVNAVLTALFTLYRREIAALLRRRDSTLLRRAMRDPARDVFADERLELLSGARICLADRLAKLSTRLGLA